MLRTRHRHARGVVARGGQRGLSLVEMMVGIAIGLFVVAGATVLAGTQLGENRRLISETQLQQDMRAALDIMTREVRRSGSSSTPDRLMWSPGLPNRMPDPNVFVLDTLSFNTGGDVIRYKYLRSGVPVQTSRYRLSAGKVQQAIERATGTTVQDVTDRNTMLVESLVVTPQYGPEVQLPCPKLCPGNTQDCWPTSRVIGVSISMTAIPGNETSAAATIRRTMQSQVRLRNDAVKFNAVDASGATAVCPT